MSKSTILAIRSPYLMILLTPFRFVISTFSSWILNAYEINNRYIDIFFEWANYILPLGLLVSIIFSIYQIYKSKITILMKCIFSLPWGLMSIWFVYLFIDSYYKIGLSDDLWVIGDIYSMVFSWSILFVWIYSLTLNPTKES